MALTLLADPAPTQLQFQNSSAGTGLRLHHLFGSMLQRTTAKQAHHISILLQRLRNAEATSSEFLLITIQAIGYSLSPPVSDRLSALPNGIIDLFVLLGILLYILDQNKTPPNIRWYFAKLSNAVQFGEARADFFKDLETELSDVPMGIFYGHRPPYGRQVFYGPGRQSPPHLSGHFPRGLAHRQPS